MPYDSTNFSWGTLVSVTVASEVLGVSRGRIYRAIAKGLLKTMKADRLCVWFMDAKKLFSKS